MILSDRDIRAALKAGEIGIEPFDDTDVQPSSVDLHVDRFFRTFHNARHPYIDVKRPMDDLTELVEVEEDEAFILHPGEFVLGSTREYVRLPDDLVARLEGKSSLGRLGLLIHSTAGYVDPGFEGHLTLELSNVANLPITIYPGMKIGQISFFRLSSAAERPYGSGGIGSKYQGQRGPTPSRYFENFKG
jgi:dCTP deaminase